MEVLLEYADDEEIWRPCENFPKYQVSHLGNVKNEKGNLLKPYKDSQGYLNVGLYVDYETYHVDSRIKISVHRLVADAFLLKDPSRPLVDHIDRNRENNVLFNLRRATYHENALNKKQSDHRNGR
jgi:hypothetical protein